MTHQVRLTRQAENDLREIYSYIAMAGAPGTARAYVDRVLDYLSSFGIFPKRGTRRDDIRPGLRVIGFERRVSIAFIVDTENVVILRVLYAGRQIDV